jgi:hypothetical protein
MQTTFKAMVRTAVSTLVLVALVGTAWAEEGSAPANPDELMAAMAAASQPGPEHARLRPLEGSWTFTSKFWMDPSQPPLETKGTIERRWVLGGRFLEERIEGTGFDPRLPIVLDR